LTPNVDSFGNGQMGVQAFATPFPSDNLWETFVETDDGLREPKAKELKGTY
jgi:hypothetical protein